MKHIGQNKETTKESLLVTLIVEEFNEFKDVTDKFKDYFNSRHHPLLDDFWDYPREADRVEIIDALGDMLVVINNYLVWLGIDGNELTKEIYDSNMSKFCYNQNDAEASIKKYSNSGIDAYYGEVGGVYYIRRKSDNKILKGINFRLPDLKRFIK